jgi:integrase
MNRPRIPSYRLHKQSGQAIVTLSDQFGRRRDVLLGKFGTDLSRAEYARVLAEWTTGGNRVPSLASAHDLTVDEVMLAYCNHIKRDYCLPDGSPSRQLHNVKDALRPLRQLYGHTPAKVFGPKALKAIQQHMINLRLCRNTINRRIGRIKSMFRWAESEEMVPPSTLHALQTVPGLARGRSNAREKEPVRPVSGEAVEATLPFLLPMLQDMVRLQQLTGMRSGELIAMRAIDLEMREDVWLYRPGSDAGPSGIHKTAHLGHQRTIAIGPRGQEIVKKYLTTNMTAYLFSPREAIAAYHAALRERRRTKVQPSQQKRRCRKPKRFPGNQYRVGSYAAAISRAVKRANLARRCDACKPPMQPCSHCRVQHVPHWHPHQLRHTKATEIRREAGLDAARAVLGHRSPQITEVYAELDTGKAAEIMARLG